MQFQEEAWVIMSKDRKYIEKGTAHSYHMRKIAEGTPMTNDRFVTYATKGRAEAAAKIKRLTMHYNPETRKVEALCEVEAVKVEFTVRELAREHQ
jgi:hypothetical protein